MKRLKINAIFQAICLVGSGAALWFATLLPSPSSLEATGQQIASGTAKINIQPEKFVGNEEEINFIITELTSTSIADPNWINDPSSVIRIVKPDPSDSVDLTIESPGMVLSPTMNLNAQFLISIDIEEEFTGVIQLGLQEGIEDVDGNIIEANEVTSIPFIRAENSQALFLPIIQNFEVVNFFGEGDFENPLYIQPSDWNLNNSLWTGKTNTMLPSSITNVIDTNGRAEGGLVTALSGSYSGVIGDPQRRNATLAQEGELQYGELRQTFTFLSTNGAPDSLTFDYRIFTHDEVFGEGKYFDTFEVYVLPSGEAVSNSDVAGIISQERDALCRNSTQETSPTAFGLVFCDGNITDASFNGLIKDLGIKTGIIDLTNLPIDSSENGTDFDIIFRVYNRQDGSFNTYTYIDNIVLR